MRMIRAVGAAVIMSILILDSRCAVAGASEGLELCVRTVIPTLFPFFVISSVLTSSLRGLPKPYLKLFRIRSNAGGVLLTGLLGGYPVGAREVSRAYENGSISPSEAKRLLPLCNQCSPAFIFGMGAYLFADQRMCLLIWLIQIVSTVILAWIIPVSDAHIQNLPPVRPVSLSVAMRQGVSSTGLVCGWIILFRMLYRFLERWTLWRLPQMIRVFICGLLELTNGYAELTQIENPQWRILLCMILTSLGGICVSMQTLSVIHPDLDKSYYFPGKVLQAGICGLLLVLLMKEFRLVLLFAAIIVGIWLFYFKKTVAFPRKRVYNEAIKDARVSLCSSEKR